MPDGFHALYDALLRSISRTPKKEKHPSGTVRCYKCKRSSVTLLKRDGKYVCKACKEKENG